MSCHRRDKTSAAKGYRLREVLEGQDRQLIHNSPNDRTAGSEPGVASQGKTRKEACAMLAEVVEFWLEAASAKEIKRRLQMGGSVQPLELAHAQCKIKLHLALD